MSVAGDVADKVVALVAALGIASGGTAVPVERRKTPTLPDGKTPPEIVVSVGEEGLSEYLDFEGAEALTYPAAVTVVTGTGAKAGDDETVRGWVQQIRRAVDEPANWAGFAGFDGITRAGRAPFDVNALSKDFNHSVQVFSVRIAE